MSITSTNDAPAIFPLDTTIVTWTADDGNGNSMTCEQLVIVTDNQDPAITCPASVNVNTDAGICTASNVTLGTPTVTDNCNMSITPTNDAPAIFPIDTTIVTWTADDGNGNMMTCEQLVIVSDNQAPSITCPATVNINTDAGICTASNVTLGTPTVTDNCNMSITSTNDAPAIFPLDTTIVTWTADDGNGNSMTCEQLVIVTDNQDPAITCPASVNVNTDAGICTASNVTLGTPTVTDNCNMSITPTNDAPAIFPIDTTIVTWTADDGNGNMMTCEQLVIVTDNQAPTITCPATVNINTDAGICTASNVTLGTPTVTDNCNMSITPTNDAPAIFPIDTTIVTWTADDGNGNMMTCEQLVIVTDNQAPTITCPATVNINTDAGLCTASNVTLGTPTVTDNCNMSITPTNDAPAIFPLDTTIVTWTADDGNGNSMTCEQLVIVSDNQAPAITCPATVTINTDAGLCTSSNVTLGTPTVTDNCNMSITPTNDAPAIFPLDTTIVTWTADDGNGNSMTCEQLLIVSDNEDPVLTCTDLVLILDTSGEGLLSTGDIDNGSTDNCSSVSLSLSQTSFTCDDLGQQMVTLSGMDAAGNSSSCEATVTVQTDIEDITVIATNPEDCGIDNGSIQISATSANQLEYSIDGGFNWMAGTFLSLPPGSYDIQVRLAGTNCAVAYDNNPVVLTCTPYDGLVVEIPSISGTNSVCEGDILTYSFPDSMLFTEIIDTLIVTIGDTVFIDTTYNIPVIPDGTLVRWVYTGFGSVTEISEPNTYNDLMIDFTGDVGEHQLVVEIDDGQNIIRDFLVITVLTQQQCELYNCGTSIFISAADMNNSIVPGEVRMKQSITSDGYVDPFDEFTFQAGDLIDLQQGFQVDRGGVFQAVIGPCND